jgi:hypothetical protein
VQPDLRHVLAHAPIDCDEILAAILLSRKGDASLDEAAIGVQKLLSLVAADAGVPSSTPTRKMRPKK